MYVMKTSVITVVYLHDENTYIELEKIFAKIGFNHEKLGH